jgi:hypothetical protein
MQLTVYPVVSKFAFSPNGSTCATTFGLRRHHSVHGVRRVRRALRDRRDPEFFFASHSRRKRIVVERVGGRGPGGGLCTSRIQLTHSSLKGAWLQPLNLKCDILVSKLAFNLTHSLKGAWFQHYLKFDILVLKFAFKCNFCTATARWGRSARASCRATPRWGCAR